MKDRNVLIIGHRGAAGEAPENTLGSFLLAVKQGCGAIELDVHYSVDGQAIVCHDYTIDRTTDRSGAIREMTAEQLREADAGSWHSENYRGERLPSLEEVFQLVPPDVSVNVEIKSGQPEHLKAFAAMLSDKGLFNRVFVSSFNQQILTDLKTEEPRVRIGYLYDQENIAPSCIRERFGVDVYSLHPHHRFVDRTLMREAEAHGLKVYPWTVNAEERMAELIEAGVSGIITDFPGKLHRLLERKMEGAGQRD